MLWQSCVHFESFFVRVTIVITTSRQNVCAVNVCFCPPFLCVSLSRCFSPLFGVSVQVSGGVFVLGPKKKGVPSYGSLTSHQTESVLKLVLQRSLQVPRGAAGELDLVNNGIMACKRCAVRVSDSDVESCSEIMQNGSVAA